MNLEFVSKPCLSLIYDKPDTVEYISEYVYSLFMVAEESFNHIIY